MAIITLEEALTHLRVDETESADEDFINDIKLKMEGVSLLVLRYCGLPTYSFLDSSGQPVNVPSYLKIACLIWLGILFKNRDGKMDENLSYGSIPVSVSNILVQFRTPPIG